MNNYCIILCGGIGSRLWPLSTNDIPKQFLTIENNNTLLHNTLKRIPKHYIKIFITSNKYQHIINEYLNNNDLLICENTSHNTGPAILAACKLIQSLNDDDNVNILVVPCDHIISDYYDNTNIDRCNIFFNTLSEAHKHIEQYIIAFGTKPINPDVSYGYIKKNNNNLIQKYKEKPNLNHAKKIYCKNNYLWNMGIFLFTLKNILQQIQIHANEIYNTLNIIKCNSDNIHYVKYNSITSISFDKLIMEKCNIGYVVEYTGLWSDIGDWSRLHNVLKIINNNNNVINGIVDIQDSNNIYANNDSDNFNIKIIGMSDTIVVKKNNNLLVMKKTN